ncbi:MAG TPA: 4Fe-4S dicluster domain-containing protein [Burkholderiales bacterium]|nr:4Fe-4S dicluster domain-containing protein [Burkholderiales bacterium]
MSLESKTLKVCSCNRTIPLDAKALAAGLKAGEPLAVHHELCRKDIGAFQAALGADRDVIVACTQEAALFSELSPKNIKFVNIRELGGWSAEKSTPKIAALIAMAALPDPEPAPAVEFKSQGQVLIIGPAAAALDWAERLAEQLEVSVLVTAGGGELPLERKYPVWSGKVTGLSGWLGAFEVEWRQENPIDLEVCTRCNACIRACPEDAIGFDYQVNLAKCKDHRDCVKACGAIGAIDFEREETARKDAFDLVLDLSREPLVRLPELPQGYFAPGDDPLEQALAAQKLAGLVGEFEKPKFFQYREKICAHSRSGKQGCNACIDVCSSGAISAAGDHVKIESHLCAGCGGCATVCPSGAMTYVYPKVPDMGARLKTALATYRDAGGKDPCILFHDGADGRATLLSYARKAKGLPGRVIPIECFHAASIGMDLMLGAMAYGASQISILLTDKTAESYVGALKRQIGYAQTIVNALGYAGQHFSLIENPADLWELQPAATVAKPASFNLAPEKRTTLDFALDHLARHEPRTIPLPAGAPFGTLALNKQTCTLCKACIGACPESALIDSTETPALRFIERNCVQCGLCVNTCPENAITLVPRLVIGKEAKEAVTLNEAEPFNCVRCGKPFGTRQMVDNMLGKLSGHSMFAGGTRRLQMCGDCRVVDMMESKAESTIFDYKK